LPMLAKEFVATNFPWQQFFAVVALFLCEAQQPFSWSFPQWSPQVATAHLSLSSFMHDFSSLPSQQAEAASPAQHELAFSFFAAVAWWQQECSAFALPVLLQHAQSVFA